MKARIALIVGLLAVVSIWAYTRVHAEAAAGPIPPHTWIAAPDEDYTLPPGQNGRYQILTASIDSVNNPHTEGGESIPSKTALRIDTQTGRTWRLVEVAGAGGYPTLSWEPLNESKLQGN
jgi:hypothetical protein